MIHNIDRAPIQSPAQSGPAHDRAIEIHVPLALQLARVLLFRNRAPGLPHTGAAFVVGQLCDIVDLDGPVFLAVDREPGLTYEDGTVWCGRDVWGSRQAVAA